MANLSTINLGDFTRLADFIWLQADNSVAQAARNSGLFKTVPFPAGSGDTREYNSIDLEEYASTKDEGDQAEQATVQQGYTKTLTLTRYGLDTSITWEMRRRNKYDDVVQRITNLSRTLSNRQDLDLSHRITFGTATSYTNKDGRTVSTTVGDGLALFSTAHTLQGSSSTFRNRLANNPQLAKGSLEAMEKQIVENTLNQLGEKMTVNFDVLWTTDDPNTMNTARELLQATAAISAPNEGVPNVYQGKYRHSALPRVTTNAQGGVDSTKAKYWGLASSQQSSGFLATEQEPTLNAPSMGSNAEDVSTEDWTFTGRISYGIVVVDANWIHFSDGLGTA